MSNNRIESLQMLYTIRNMRNRGPKSSAVMNDIITETGHDIAAIVSQWNNSLVPLTSVLPNGTPSSNVDAFTYGLDGRNMYVNYQATSGTYYTTTYARPKTIHEQFVDVYSNLVTLQSSLEETITASYPTASDITIADTGSLFVSTEVESALAELRNIINVLERSLDLSAVDQHYLPKYDNTYNLGSSSYRLQDLHLGPSSLNIISKTTDGSGAVDRTFSLEVPTTGADVGTLELKQDSTVVLKTTSTSMVVTPEVEVPALYAGVNSSDPPFENIVNISSTNGLLLGLHTEHTTTTRSPTLYFSRDSGSNGVTNERLGDIAWYTRSDGDFRNAGAVKCILGANATGTGYQPGTLRFQTSGVDRMYISGAGNTCVGPLAGAPATSSAFEVRSTTGALLLPRMTTTQRNALTATNGMIIYNTTANRLQGYQNSAWINIDNGGAA